MPEPKARPRSARAKPQRAEDKPVVVPDTSVLIDGRITRLVQRNELASARILIPQAVISELEFQANQGRESGFNGLDEIVKIQELKGAADLDVEFVGDRPTPEDIELAASGEIDAMIRQVAVDHGARLLTSDRVLAHVARAMGLSVEYIRPVSEPEELEADLSQLEIMKYFDPDTMSVHLKYNVPPYAKKGTPGKLTLVKLSEKPLPLQTLTRMRRELIEAARRDADSFVEIERHGATVVQLGPMRIAIAQPPFSDGLEITAVRPVTRLTLEQYNLAPELRARLKDYQRGVFVSGPPGSGKSTFVTSIAEWLKDQGTIVKTMESPRDLQVSDEITQYAPLERDMALTSDILLLVRPDFVVYDEVRKTSDFQIFGDMRLAGVGLIGVTHANRAIDAVQRLIGRVELGMIPQVVDTVIHIEKGQIRQVMELSFTVKVPAGMQEADLARPVIEVRDFSTKRSEFEIYTYGEQIVVMPVGAGRKGAAATPRDRLAAAQLRHQLRTYIQGRFDVEMTSDGGCALYVEDWEVPRIIGKAGKVIQSIESEMGVKIDVRPFSERTKGAAASSGKGDAAPRHGSGAPHRGPRARVEEELLDDEEEDLEEALEEDAGRGEPARSAPGGRERRYAELTPELRKTKKNIVLLLRKDLAGQEVSITVDGEILFRATVGTKGDVRVSRRSPEGQALFDALARGELVTVRI